MNENTSHSYKKLSHFSDMVLKMNNEPDKIVSYTNKQFEEDLEKWVSETKYKNYEKIGVNTITISLSSDNNNKKIEIKYYVNI
jgi:predicted fused transcriptional regulator/phosphomethylpyrimidine kinase